MSTLQEELRNILNEHTDNFEKVLPDKLIEAFKERIPKRRPTTHDLKLSVLAEEISDVDGYELTIDGTFNQAIDLMEKTLLGEETK